MPTITDELGERQVSEAELGLLRAEADREYDAFWNGLEWRPIAEYDKATGEGVMLVGGELSAFGYWGDALSLGGSDDDDTSTHRNFCWRNLRDCEEAGPIGFEPERFAAIGDEWGWKLKQD